MHICILAFLILKLSTSCVLLCLEHSILGYFVVTVGSVKMVSPIQVYRCAQQWCNLLYTLVSYAYVKQGKCQHVYMILLSCPSWLLKLYDFALNFVSLSLTWTFLEFCIRFIEENVYFGQTSSFLVALMNWILVLKRVHLCFL